MPNKSMPKKAPRNNALFAAQRYVPLRKLNDIFIESQLAVQGLKTIRADFAARQAKKQTRYRLLAPSIKAEPVGLSRNISTIIELVDARISSKEYVQSLVFSIALIEDYISTCLTLIIRAYPQKLLTSAKGKQAAEDEIKTIMLKDVIEAKSIGDLISDKAEKRVRDALYATPTQLKGYMASIFGFAIKDDIWGKYVELKATRDIYVHGDGRANDIYVGKAGALARAKRGDMLPIDSAYFNDSIVCLKNVLTDVYRGLKSKYGDSAEVHKILKTTP
ncbi:hypothetical protein ABI_09610 [Asticcacaulis biprosthecium C19]|uniref:RiboL-PSP-HEPN domain-containing protein n=2 Tax=Asticcacaulis biprosthecium TaxID=76891 RepID=F4QGS2_9CAUL|nr:hypothetical protein ABI_09610 [Asticcacaulis biprosthecium C19]